MSDHDPTPRLVARWDRDLDLLVVRDRVSGPAGLAALPLGSAIELHADHAERLVLCELALEVPGGRLDAADPAAVGFAEDVLRADLDDVLRSARRGSPGLVRVATGYPGALDRALGRTVAAAEELAMLGDLVATPGPPVMTAAPADDLRRGALALEGAIATTVARAALRPPSQRLLDQLGQRWRWDGASLLAALIDDDGGRDALELLAFSAPGVAGTLAKLLHEGASRLEVDPPRDDRTTGPRLARRLREIADLVLHPSTEDDPRLLVAELDVDAAADMLASPVAPSAATPPAPLSAATAGGARRAERARKEPPTAPVEVRLAAHLDARAFPPPGIARYRREHEIEVTLSPAMRHAIDGGWWARVVQVRDGLPLASVPVNEHGIARALVPPDITPAHLVIDLTDQPGAPLGRSATGEAVQRAVAAGRRACRAERLGDEPQAEQQWHDSADAWRAGDDDRRAGMARSFAEGAVIYQGTDQRTRTRGRRRAVDEPFAADQIP